MVKRRHANCPAETGPFSGAMAMVLAPPFTVGLNIEEARASLLPAVTRRPAPAEPTPGRGHASLTFDGDNAHPLHPSCADQASRKRRTSATVVFHSEARSSGGRPQILRELPRSSSVSVGPSLRRTASRPKPEFHPPWQKSSSCSRLSPPSPGDRSLSRAATSPIWRPYRDRRPSKVLQPGRAVRLPAWGRAVRRRRGGRHGGSDSSRRRPSCRAE
jgi:hypothetical protein